ncbi:hypothetical protein EFR51_02345, partial [Latilactobacillus curvatus]|uniref:hypothetical protein n=1 Tax=Latilactobacillus curvatus TaxID=28038 RepID=UPI0021A4CF2E
GPVVSLAPQLLFDNGLFWDCPQRLANLFLQFTKSFLSVHANNIAYLLNVSNEKSEIPRLYFAINSI